jgi:hypothetical protein
VPRRDWDLVPLPASFGALKGLLRPFLIEEPPRCSLCGEEGQDEFAECRACGGDYSPRQYYFKKSASYLLILFASLGLAILFWIWRILSVSVADR